MKNRSRLLDYKGTNGHAKQFKLSHSVKMHLSVYALLVFITLTAIVFGKLRSWQLDQAMKIHFVYAMAPEKQIPVKILTEHEKIIAYIHEVFGKDSDKAMKLLSCENHALSPLAVNDNTTWGGIGQDIGIFQINNQWQGVSNRAFLYDWRINIDMAYNIFSRDNYSFRLWTCGRKLGI